MPTIIEAHQAGRNIETVRVFLRLLEEKDIDSWMELWDEDADHIYPYGTHMFPPHLTGKQAIHDRWKQLPDSFASLSFPIQEIWSDGDTVIVRFDGELVREGGEVYRNGYLCIFKFTDVGKLREYWEYFDPILAGVAFGLAKITYLES
jgi:ketosteroid isomerase-like protein